MLQCVIWMSRFVVFFKQKTAYEMRISDWSSDVCSSDLVNRMTSKARRVVRELFDHYLARPDCLPDEWQSEALDLPQAERARLVADYIAGMTDRLAQTNTPRLSISESSTQAPFQAFPRRRYQLGREECRERGWPYG